MKQSLAHELKRVFKCEQVASLSLVEELDNAETIRYTLMLSGGHDGLMCTYVLDANTFGALTIKLVGREALLPSSNCGGTKLRLPTVRQLLISCLWLPCDTS